MIIHKSQGSEFEEVLVVLPDENSRILSQELIYTGVTRAKGAVSMRCLQEMLTLGLSRGVERTSGLAILLRKSLNGKSTVLMACKSQKHT
jgi:exodeoxyribonuclease V alpha subunit